MWVYSHIKSLAIDMPPTFENLNKFANRSSRWIEKCKQQLVCVHFATCLCSVQTHEVVCIYYICYKFLKACLFLYPFRRLKFCQDRYFIYVFTVLPPPPIPVLFHGSVVLHYLLSFQLVLCFFIFASLSFRACHFLWVCVFSDVRRPLGVCMFVCGDWMCVFWSVRRHDSVGCSVQCSVELTRCAGHAHTHVQGPPVRHWRRPMSIPHNRLSLFVLLFWIFSVISLTSAVLLCLVVWDV